VTTLSHNFVCGSFQPSLVYENAYSLHPQTFLQENPPIEIKVHPLAPARQTIPLPPNYPILDLTGPDSDIGWSERDALPSYQLSASLDMSNQLQLSSPPSQLPHTISFQLDIVTTNPSFLQDPTIIFTSNSAPEQSTQSYSIPFSHLHQVLLDNTTSSTLLLAASVICKHVEAHRDHLTPTETTDLIFLLRTLHLAHRSESASRHHLWQLCKHIEYIRNPDMSVTRRQAAELIRHTLSTSDNTTLGQLKRLDLFIEPNADLQPHRDALYLSDLDLAFSNLQHKVDSLRDHIQFQLRRLHPCIYSELHRRRIKTTTWPLEVQQYNNQTGMGDPLSHFARIIASDFYNDLQPHSADTSPLVLELVSSQWINSTNDIHLLDSNPTQITLTHLQ